MSRYTPTSKHYANVTPAIGQSVETTSGEYVGVVSAVAEGRFELACEPPMWLTNKSVFTSNGDRLTLMCESQGLPRFCVQPD